MNLSVKTMRLSLPLKYLPHCFSCICSVAYNGYKLIWGLICLNVICVTRSTRTLDVSVYICDLFEYIVYQCEQIDNLDTFVICVKVLAIHVYICLSLNTKPFHKHTNILSNT